jgi:hypothetical protein
MGRQLFLMFVVLSGLILFVGCEQKTSVSGMVTYNGQPIENGAISFKPTGSTGRSFAGGITNGKYEIPEAQPGAWTAIIIGTKKIDFAMSSDEAAKRANELKASGSDMAGQVSELADYVPADAEGNSKQVEITAGSQTLDFDIKGPPRS